MADPADSSPLIPPPIIELNEIDLEAGPGEQIQCRICLETDGTSLWFRSFCLGFVNSVALSFVKINENWSRKEVNFIMNHVPTALGCAYWFSYANVGLHFFKL